jgi:hypothetical protein
MQAFLMARRCDKQAFWKRHLGALVALVITLAGMTALGRGVASADPKIDLFELVVLGNVSVFNELKHTTWAQKVFFDSSGWNAGEVVTISLHGPLNWLPPFTPGSDLRLTTVTADNMGGVPCDTFFIIPYDEKGGGTIPRPGLYEVVATGSSGRSATYDFNIAPGTIPGQLPGAIVKPDGDLKKIDGGNDVDYHASHWGYERGGRDGYLDEVSPERVDPHWASVWSEEPVGFYGTVVPELDGNKQPSTIAHTDWPGEHYAHDSNVTITPDPEYQWVASTRNPDAPGNLLFPGLTYTSRCSSTRSTSSTTATPAKIPLLIAIMMPNGISGRTSPGSGGV